MLSDHVPGEDTPARTLIVLRHAEAAQVPGLSDRERPLTGDGERDARRVGATLRALGHHPDLVLCSPAERTRRTAELALAELPSDAPVDIESDLYGAYADELLGIVRATAPDVGTLLLVGHNPGVHELVMGLTTHTADPGFPPASFAVIRFTGEWAELEKGETLTRWSPRTG